MPTSPAILIKSAAWRTSFPGYRPALQKAVVATFRHAEVAPKALTIALSGDRAVQHLNRDFRGKDKPTNVLSFPADEPDYLGDVILAHGVVEREAKEQQKPFANHATHLVVHGVLHLLGYDHETDAEDAKKMESLEKRILAKLGIPNPY
ncbi:MAG: rRNA maturation RNase YbeY [Alphaproteobacteria bacterium]|nr:rRNA maturation RNase YbeY [Alphaproteobacteria bacterium]